MIPYIPKLRVVGSIPIARSNYFNDLGDKGAALENRMSAECPCKTFGVRSRRDSRPAYCTIENLDVLGMPALPPMPITSQGGPRRRDVVFSSLGHDMTGKR
jgi:hypothetical protein